MNLSEFLLARIAEDEERGHSLVVQWSDVGNACQSCGTDGTRVLAECEAKRRIVDFYRAVPDGMQEHYRAGLGRSLRCLALPYADHPDYRDEWRP